MTRHENPLDSDRLPTESFPPVSLNHAFATGDADWVRYSVGKSGAGEGIQTPDCNIAMVRIKVDGDIVL